MAMPTHWKKVTAIPSMTATGNSMELVMVTNFPMVQPMDLRSAKATQRLMHLAMLGFPMTEMDLVPMLLPRSTQFQFEFRVLVQRMVTAPPPAQMKQTVPLSHLLLVWRKQLHSAIPWTADLQTMLAKLLHSAMKIY